MSHYHIEQLGRESNSEMLEILSSSPIVTKDLTICFDRQPDMFILPDIKYDPYYYWGLYRDEILRGFGMIGYHTGMVNGKPETVFHLKDLYITEDARGKGFILRLAELLFKSPYRNSSIGYAVLMTGNKDIHRYVGYKNPRFPFIPDTSVINQLDVRNILLTFPVSVNSEFRVRLAAENDIPAIVALLNNEHRDRLFGKVYSESGFMDYLSRCRGLSIGNYFLVDDKDGNTAGVCAAWDCSCFRQTRVLNYGKGYKKARISYKILSLLFNLPRLPAQGECLKDIIITDYAVRGRDPVIMNALLKAVYSEFRKQGYHNMIWGSSADDPLLEASKGFLFKKVISDIVLVKTPGQHGDLTEVNCNLPYIDIPGL